jgi:hypothetical protein
MSFWRPVVNRSCSHRRSVGKEGRDHRALAIEIGQRDLAPMVELRVKLGAASPTFERCGIAGLPGEHRRAWRECRRIKVCSFMKTPYGSVLGTVIFLFVMRVWRRVIPSGSLNVSELPANDLWLLVIGGSFVKAIIMLIVAHSVAGAPYPFARILYLLLASFGIYDLPFDREIQSRRNAAEDFFCAASSVLSRHDDPIRIAIRPRSLWLARIQRRFKAGRRLHTAA